MKFYATVKNHSVIGCWEEMKGVKTLTGAKRKATKEYGSGYHGHVIHVVECSPSELESGQINDLPSHTKAIGPASSGWRYND